MKKVVISCGPIPARLDSVKFITNRFKGGLAFRTAEHLINQGKYDVTIVRWKHTSFPGKSWPLKSPWNQDNVHVVDVEDVFGYYNWYANHAAEYDAFIMAAAVANLTPSEPYKGKFPSHKYAVGESFPIQFEIAPRAIDVIKQKNPRACLIGYKLFDAASDEELVDIARHTLADAKANIIFANTPATAKTKKIAVMPDNTALPCSFDEHLGLICRAIDNRYFRTEIVSLAGTAQSKGAVDEAIATVKMFEKTFSNGFGTVAVPVKGGPSMFDTPMNVFATTSRGHKGEPVIVCGVDYEKGIVYATGKATLNAPTLAGVLAQAPEDTFVVHRHDDDPLFDKNKPAFAMADYLFPGTLEEAHAVTKAFGTGVKRVKLLGHGDIAIKPIRKVDWTRYYEDFPERYFGISKDMQEIIEKYNDGETLEIGCNGTACTKYAYDPFVEAGNAINLTFAEAIKKHYDLIVAKNSINYLSFEELWMLVDAADRFVANTFLRAPQEKVTSEEAAVLVPRPMGMAVSHTLRLKDDSIARHEFWARSQEDYEALGLKVTPYGKNSALLTKNT